MAATTEVHVFHAGSSGTLPTGANDQLWTDGARFHWADTSPTTDGATTFIAIPTDASTAYSYRKHFLLKISGGTYGSISNLRWFSDGVAVGTGVTMYVSLVNNPAGYTLASASDKTALANSAVAGQVTVAAADAVTYTSSGSQMTVNAGTVASSNAVGYGTQSLVVMQVGVTSAASGGTTSARTYTYRWQET